MRWLKARLKRLLSGASPGFTLAEVLVSVGIAGITTGLIGGAIFQALGVTRYWQDDVIATKELRQAGSWFAGDAKNARNTDLVDGNPPASSVTLTWTDSVGVSHTATYSLSGSSLIRNLDGASITVARRVVLVEFSRSGRTLTFYPEVEAGRGGTESISLPTYARRLQ